MVQEQTVADHALDPGGIADKRFALLLLEHDLVPHGPQRVQMFCGALPGAGDKQFH